jgi:polysaccharide export outer membrane protein
MTIASGDMLDVRVFNTPELSTQARVDDKGQVLLPVAGAIPVTGLTSAQVAAAIEKTLRDHEIMADPRVTVLVTEYATQGITVTGEVKNPGIYSLLGTHNLYDVLSAAGGPGQNAGGIITITHKRDLDHPEVVRVTSPNYSELEQRTPVLPGDTVNVSRAGMFYVVGDVGRSGAFYLQNGQPLTVLNALALAQGPNYTARTRHASLIRKADARTEVLPVNVKLIAEAKQPDVQLHDGDILFVPGSLFKRISVTAIPQLATSLANASATVGIVQ